MARIRKRTINKKISKNTSVNISYTIKKVKDHEQKYTIILVVFFMIIFAFIGYHSLKISNMVSSSEEGLSIKEKDKLFGGSPIIELSESQEMNSEDGLKQDPYIFEMENRSNQEVSFRISLQESEALEKEWGYEEQKIENFPIKYSKDNQTVETLGESNIIMEGILKPKEKEKLPIQVWLDTMPNKEEYHFLGYFILEEIKKAE